MNRRVFGWAVVSLSTLLLGCTGASSGPAPNSQQLQQKASSGAQDSMEDMKKKMESQDAPAMSPENKAKMDEMMNKMKTAQPGAAGAGGPAPK